MSKFGNKSFAPSTQSSGNNSGGDVDWAGLNAHVAGAVQEALGCDEGTPAAVIGIISGIVDYGKHQDPERVEPMDEGDAKAKKWKSDMVAKGKAENREGVFHYQASACQEIGVYVDFPSVIVDKGQFFGDSNPAPYRVLLGGVFKGEPAQKTKIQGYRNDNKVWVFGDNSRATKLAKAAKLKDLKDGFAQERLLELIGQAVQFNAEVFVNDAGFLQEKITNPSPIMAGIPIPEIDQDLLFYVGMNEDNEDSYVKVLTKPVKEYCKAALDFEGSKLSVQLEALESSSQASQKPSQGSSPSGTQTPAQESKTSQSEAQKPQQQYNEPPEIDFDSEIPF